MKTKEIEVEKPLPCPFCGRECVVCIGGGISIKDYYYVKCANGHSLSRLTYTPKKAIETWNERV